MLYGFLKLLLRPALHGFYEPTTVEGREHVAESGPLVVVANHPNTLLDPLLVGIRWRRQLRFLTNSRFFVSVGGWVLRAAGAIPLYRQEDYRPKAGEAPPENLTQAQRAARNDESFRAAFEVLAAGGAMLIFPEGSSVLTQRLRPVMSGAARIALGAEARHDWRLGVRIVPVGLNYAAAYRFRSQLLVRIGAPLDVAAYRERYEAHPQAAIRALTEAIRRALEQQLVMTRPGEDEQLLQALSTLVQPLETGAHPPGLASEPAAGQELALPGSLLEALSWLEAQEPGRATGICRRLYAYRHAGQEPGRPLNLLQSWVRLLLGSPVWLWGIVNNYPAYWLPAQLARRLTKEVEFTASLLLVAGMLTLPLVYSGQTWLVWHLTYSAPLTAAYLVLLPLTGLFALTYGRRLADQWRQWRRSSLGHKRENQLAALRRERESLLLELKRTHAEWQQHRSPAAAENQQAAGRRCLPGNP